MKAPRARLLPLGILAIAVLGGLALLATAPSVDMVAPRAAAPAVRVMSAEPRSLPQVVRSQGTVAPRTESELVPEVSGRVVWTAPSLATGGFFNDGDLLLSLDDRDHQTALARAEANLARSQGEWEHAGAMLTRREELARKDVNSTAQLDDARRAARVADAVREETRAAVRQATRDLERTQIRAPFTGRVRDERVDVGQFLSRGQAIATLYAIDYVEIRLPVPDNELAFLSLPLFAGTALEEGPAVTLRANFAGREQQWSGRIVRTEGEIDPRSRMVHVVARVEEPYAASRSVPLAVGLFVEAEIDGPELSGVLSIPRAALREDESILRVDEANRLYRLPVEVVRVERERALIRAELPPGSKICVSRVEAFVPGMVVAPVPSPELAVSADPETAS